MIKAVAFDWGGVLIKDPAPDLFKYCARYFGVKPEAFAAAWDACYIPFETGQIGEKDYWTIINDFLLTNKRVKKGLWGEAVRHVFRDQTEVLELARKLKTKGYKIGFLSNTEGPTMEHFWERGYDFIDSAIFSCKEKIMKPDARIYLKLCESLGTKPEETVFIDDKKEYSDGATAAGLIGIKFDNIDQLVHELLKYKVKA